MALVTGRSQGSRTAFLVTGSWHPPPGLGRAAGVRGYCRSQDTRGFHTKAQLLGWQGLEAGFWRPGRRRQVRPADPRLAESLQMQAAPVM